MSKFVYKRRTAVDIHLRLLDCAVGAETDAYEDVLITLGAGIRKSVKRIEHVENDDVLVDVETQLIENMLGTAYVVCQSEINAVVQAALKVADNAPRVTIFQGEKPSERESSVRKLGPQFNRKLSTVEILWHLGNYFKHRDEWNPVTWDGGSKWTLEAIKAAGLQPLSSGNLRRGAEALGNEEYADTAVFQEIIRSWSENVRKQIRAKLGLP